jgi:Flp pilus assembly protein TadB
VSSQHEDERLARARRARQVLAGQELRAPEHPLDFGAPEGLIDATQRTYLIVLAALLGVALLLYLIWGLGPASPILFILALALLAGWLVF